MDIARVNLLPTQCAVQVNNTHLQSYSEDECKKKMRIHPCEEGRIIFKISNEYHFTVYSANIFIRFKCFVDIPFCECV